MVYQLHFLHSAKPAILTKSHMFQFPLSAFIHAIQYPVSAFHILRSAFHIPHSAFRASIPDSASIVSSFTQSSPKLNHTFIYLASCLPFDFCFSKQTLLNFPRL